MDKNQNDNDKIEMAMTKTEMTMTKIEMAMTKTEMTMTKIEMTKNEMTMTKTETTMTKIKTLNSFFVKNKRSVQRHRLGDLREFTREVRSTNRRLSGGTHERTEKGGAHCRVCLGRTEKLRIQDQPRE